MASKNTNEEFQDHRFGRVRRFNDYWRNAKAVCFLFGDGPGSEGELVRLIGRPKRGGDGFEVFYIRSYEPRKGHAARAYDFIHETYGAIDAREIVSPAGLAFNKAMKETGLAKSCRLGNLPMHRPLRNSGAIASFLMPWLYLVHILRVSVDRFSPTINSGSSISPPKTGTTE